MKRRVLLRALAALPALGFLRADSALAGGNPYYSGPVTPRFDGRRFRNPDGFAGRGFGDFLRWRAESRDPWPDAVPSPHPPDRPPPRVERGVRVAFVGHMSFLIQTAGLNLLTDPVYSERASPFAVAGPRRYNPPGIPFEALPRIDAVLLSHAHYDHMDLDTLARLRSAHGCRVLTPLGNDAILRAHDADLGAAATTGDWGDEVDVGNGVRVRFEPAHHWSARALTDRNCAFWSGFTVASRARAIYFAGDTGFDRGRPFEAVAAARRGRPHDVALLPIGAYAPRWFMSPQHMDPEEAVRALEILKSPRALGGHWGTFRLTNESAYAPAEELTAALTKRGIPPERFAAALPGQVLELAG